MGAVKLYKFPLVIDLTLLDHGVRNYNMPFRDSDFKAYRGTFNNVDFIIRDNDRKAVNLTGKTLVMSIFHHHDGDFIIQIPVHVVDPQKGRVRICMTPQTVDSWEVGFYRYSILINFEDGTHNLLYMDQNQNAQGFFEFADGVLPQLVESTEILGEHFTPTNQTPPTTAPTLFVTGAVPGDATQGDDDGLHTVAIYADNYAGKFWVQGSLDENPGVVDHDWFDIWLTATTPYWEFGNTPDPDSTFTGIEPFNWTASVRWIRFKHQPDVDNTGEIQKVLYRH